MENKLGISNQKQKIRQNMLTQLHKLTSTTKDDCNLQAMKYISNLLDESNSIAIYHARNDEFSLNKVIDYCLKHNKKLYQPVAYKNTRIMLLQQFNNHQTETFSKREYVPLYSYEWYNLDLVILPVVAVDKKGYRLGRGGGYYDSTLPHKSETSTKLCGIGYACQQIPQIPHESFDVKLDYFVSENGLTSF